MSAAMRVKLLLLLLVVCVAIKFATAARTTKSKSQVNSSKSLWPPWQSGGSSCLPFWPFRCSDVPPPAPSTPELPLAAPILPPLLPPLPKILPPPSQLPLVPSISTLLFKDLRLAVVYPVIQKLKNIITSDPLGITNTWVGADICSYKGFFCDIPPDNASATAIASVDFNGYGLTAPSIDGFIDQLPDLAVFHANSNNFGGTVSPNIAKLKYLYELDLSNNKFTGPFPQAVVGMDSLTFLDIRFNLFSGSIPPAIFTLNLQVLFLNDNNFLSALPATLGSTQIQYLTLADNKFTGPLPRDIAKALSALNEVLLLNNQLTGCLPYELGFLYKVTVLDISNNQLTGPLPFSLACLQNVQLLDFSSNLLYGMVPDLLCQLPMLGNLSLANNYFTEVGPFCRILIAKGVLDVRNNCVPDLPFQRSVVECAEFMATPHVCPYAETYSIIPCKPHFHH